VGSERTFAISVDGNSIRGTASDGITMQASIHGGLVDGTIESQPNPKGSCTIPGQSHPLAGQLSSDAGVLNLDYVWSSYETHDHIVNPMGATVGFNCLLCSVVCDAVTVSGTQTVHLQLTRLSGQPSLSRRKRKAAAGYIFGEPSANNK
jgi:hypothetical protein